MQTLVQFLAAALIMTYAGTNLAEDNPSEKATANFNKAHIQVIGHGGSGFVYPIMPFNPLPANSMASIQKALIQHDADGVELDVQMSQDGQLLLYHDANLKKIGLPSASVSQLPAEKIVGKPYNTGFVYNFFHDEKVISFDTFLRWYTTHAPGKYLHLDLKNFDDAYAGDNVRAEQMALELVRLLVQHQVPINRLVIGSSDKYLLLMLKEMAPGLTLMLDLSKTYEADFAWLQQNQLDGIIVGHKEVNPEIMQAARTRKLQVIVFGGKARKAIEQIVALQPDAIQVNNVRGLQEVLY